MAEPLNISIEALAASHGSALINMVERATLNSFGKVVNVIEEPEKHIQFSIQTTADKLDQLSFALADAEISLKNGAETILGYVSEQYSMFRDVHLSLMIGYL